MKKKVEKELWKASWPIPNKVIGSTYYHMELKFKTTIEQHYNLSIKSCTAAPRQFVAETYILDDVV